MTNPISSVVALPAFAPQHGAAPEASSAPAPPEAPASFPEREPAGAASGMAAKPIALSVDRDATGVFVYTLTDSASGRVLAVIPRSAVATAAQQQLSRGVDIQA